MGNRKSKESKDDDDDDSKKEEKKKEYFVPKSIKGLTVTATILLFVTMLGFFLSVKLGFISIPLMLSALASLMAILGAFIRDKKPIHEFFKTEEERTSFNKTKGDGRVGVTKDVVDEHIKESPYMVEAYDASWGKYTSVFIGIFGIIFATIGFVLSRGTDAFTNSSIKIFLGVMYLIFGCIYAAYVFRKYKKQLGDYIDKEYKYERKIVVDNRLKIFKSGDIQSINAKKEALRTAIDAASINICSNKDKIKTYMSTHITNLAGAIDGTKLKIYAGLSEEDTTTLSATDTNKDNLRNGLKNHIKANVSTLMYNTESFFGATLSDDQLEILNDLIVEIYVDLLVMPMIVKDPTTNEWVLKDKENLEENMKSELNRVLDDVCKNVN